MSQIYELIKAVQDIAIKEKANKVSVAEKRSAKKIAEAEKKAREESVATIAKEEVGIFKIISSRAKFMSLDRRTRAYSYMKSKLYDFKLELIDFINNTNDINKTKILSILFDKINIQGEIVVDKKWERAIKNVELKNGQKVVYVDDIGGGFIFRSSDDKIFYDSTTSQLVNEVWQNMEIDLYHEAFPDISSKL